MEKFFWTKKTGDTSVTYLAKLMDIYTEAIQMPAEEFQLGPRHLDNLGLDNL